MTVVEELRRSLAAYAARAGVEDPGFSFIDDEAVQELRTIHTMSERRLRLAAWAVLSRMPYGVYRPVTTLAKRVRGGSGPDGIIDVQGRYQTAWDAVAPERAPLVVCLTHDVDTLRCHEFSSDVMTAEEEVGVHGSWNVLTQGAYVLDAGWLDEVEARGHEIGLHGDTHDAAIGFRPVAEIRARLQACLEVLDRPVMGYRAPALGVSEPLLGVLAELGFAYDSSSKGLGLFRNGVPAGLPYRHPAADVWELPLAVTDDALFRDWDLDDDQALALVRDLLDLHRSRGGLVVINSHPVNLEGHMSYYRGLLEDLALRQDAGTATVVRPCDLVEDLQRRLIST